MKNIIPIFGMLSLDMFFIIITMFGLEYKGAEESSIYIIYCIIVGILNILLIPYYFIIERKYMKMTKILFLLLPCIPVICFMFNIDNEGINSLKLDFFKYFILWGVPAIYAAVYVNAKDLFRNMVKWFEVVMILATISIFISAIINFSMNIKFQSLGGATYQTASYVSAFAYGINLYFIFLGKDQERFSFTKTIIYYVLNKVFLVVQLLGIAITGGRGGAVLALIYTIYISINVIREKKIKNVTKWTIYILVLFIALLIAQSLFLKNNLIINSINRILSYVSKDGIVWKETSGRDIIFGEAIDLIKDKPIFGYGLYGFLDVYPQYPHNIFLEFMLNGGVIYTIIQLIILGIIFNKYRKISNLNKNNKFFMILLLYPITLLMFSGSYMRNSAFWFVITLILTCDYKKDIEVKLDVGK